MMDKLRQLSQLAGMFGNMGKMREEMERFQERIVQITAEGDAGGGMVRVRVNGKFEVLACMLSEDAFKLGDRELLQDLLVGAFNQALEKIRQQLAEETGKMASGMGLPPGMNLPGLPFPGAS